MEFKNYPAQTAMYPTDVEHFDQKLKEVHSKIQQLNPYHQKSAISKSMLDHAIEYATQGYKILPLHYPTFK